MRNTSQNCEILNDCNQIHDERLRFSLIFLLIITGSRSRCLYVKSIWDIEVVEFSSNLSSILPNAL